MAKTAQEIEQLIDNEAANYTELDELQSSSSGVAFWSYAKDIFIFMYQIIEGLFDSHKLEVNELIDDTETGGVDWYVAVSNEFQYGDNLVVVNNRPIYSVINEANQIIARTSIIEDSNTTLFIKVVKEVSDELVKLDPPELAAFMAYMNRRKIAGTKLDIDSLDPDLLEIAANATLDPILYDSNGLLILDASEPVLDAIKLHLKNFDFGGTFYLSKLIDDIMDIPGVIDFYITSSNLNTVPFSNSVQSDAGHIKYDDINSTLTYVLS